MRRQASFYYHSPLGCPCVGPWPPAAWPCGNLVQQYTITNAYTSPVDGTLISSRHESDEYYIETRIKGGSCTVTAKAASEWLECDYYDYYLYECTSWVPTPSTSSCFYEYYLESGALTQSRTHLPGLPDFPWSDTSSERAIKMYYGILFEGDTDGYWNLRLPMHAIGGAIYQPWVGGKGVTRIPVSNYGRGATGFYHLGLGYPNDMMYNLVTVAEV